MITREKLLKFSMWQAIIGALVFVINYFFFHFVTDDGITLVWHPEAGKPFVADLIGVFGTLFLFGAAVTLLASFIFFDKNNKSEENK
ncbi:MAG: hypothetical protein E7676_00595 [Ruminococcaceae bacterium]|nr:hypothetical protein [Oscillospiraceae bacterium]